MVDLCQPSTWYAVRALKTDVGFIDPAKVLWNFGGKFQNVLCKLNELMPGINEFMPGTACHDLVKFLYLRVNIKQTNVLSYVHWIYFGLDTYRYGVQNDHSGIKCKRLLPHVPVFPCVMYYIKHSSTLTYCHNLLFLALTSNFTCTVVEVLCFWRKGKLSPGTGTAQSDDKLYCRYELTVTLSLRCFI